MKIQFKKHIGLALLFIVLNSCNSNTETKNNHEGDVENKAHDHDHGHHHDESQVKLSVKQIEELGIDIQSVATRNLSSTIQTNGQLEVPPQNEATVTAIVGANIVSIKVIEGDKVTKGQALAEISHPRIIKLQTEYLSSWNTLKYLKSEYERQQKLYKEEVSSGKEFQKTSAEYGALTAEVAGLKAQLTLLNISVLNIEENGVQSKTSILSPIDGFIRMVEVKTGQYVDAATELFEIVNIHHIHADFMVYEKDIHLVEKGQKVRFKVSSLPNDELEATIYSVGKAFENEPKAIHIHAEIENKKGLLLPGMFARGKIQTGSNYKKAVPLEAICMNNGEAFIFVAKLKKDVWTFKPLKVKLGIEEGDWVEIIESKEFLNHPVYALNNAYLLMAELKKEEAEHSH